MTRSDVESAPLPTPTDDPPGSLAAAIRCRDPKAIAQVLARAVVPGTALLVPRPWGGHALAAHKDIACNDHSTIIGESFEVSAAPSDAESRAWPSIVRLDDGSHIALSDLLCACPEILGAAHIEAFGHELPLLPKLLDIRQLLSIQAHPPGHPEAYYIIAADPGATVHLGWAADIDPEAFAASLNEARLHQDAVAAALEQTPTLADLVTTYLTHRDAPPPELPAPLAALGANIEQLRQLDDSILRQLNPIEVHPGMLLYNATRHPQIGSTGATVHALGNPQGRAILALEIRLAGPTLRLWDHGRLPVRPLHTAAALHQLGTCIQPPQSFIVATDPKASAQRCIDDDVFAIDLLRPAAGLRRPGETRPQVIHVVAGAITIQGPSGPCVHLNRGHTALIPASWSEYVVQGTPESEAIAAAMKFPPTALSTRTRALSDLRTIVANSEGPNQAIVIANGGDREPVRHRLDDLKTRLFRRDGNSQIYVHEERTRRGQLLGLLDAMAAWQEHNRSTGVALGIMLPGQGKRLSPLTQRFHGIKPFIPVPVRVNANSPWFDAAGASMWSWVYVTRQLERMGFAGVAWKWGDEPQIPSAPLGSLNMDLSQVDAVRFGMATQLTDDLARNKEWLLCDDAGNLQAQLRRRPLADLQARLSASRDDTRALVHIGSPALSFAMLDALAQEFGSSPGWLDIDGYLFEALTHRGAAWEAEVARDDGLRQLLHERPDFHQRVQAVRSRLEQQRGHALKICVIDFGEQAYWGDMGQLRRARDSYAVLAHPGESAEFARRLAALEPCQLDRFGNRVYGQGSRIPQDGSVTDSVIVNSCINSGRVAQSVIFDSQLGHVQLDSGCVIVNTTATELSAGTDAFVMSAVASRPLVVAAGHVCTSIVEDPTEHNIALQHWFFDMNNDPGENANYEAAFGNNPCSFAEKFQQMRQREISVADLEARVRDQHRRPIVVALGLPDTLLEPR